MKGDFSRWNFTPGANYSGVLYQQGRVRTDADDNAQTQIDSHWRKTAARDIIGEGVAAVPAAQNDGFKVIAAKVSGGAVFVQLNPGRVWADGLHLYLSGTGPVEVAAPYLAPPLQTPQADVASIKDGVRDAVVLDVWEESVSAFQEPLELLEPALGGPDTTERARVCAALKLMRLGPNDDCSAVAGAADNFDAKGKLTVTPSPAIVIPGDCPVEAGGGYTGFEHYLYRIEIADPEPGTGQARFKWSQFNGGLVGRGTFTAGAVPGTGTVTITGNDQMINHCGLSTFHIEKLDRDPVFGCWSVVASADASLPLGGGTLALTNTLGAWASTPTFFFRLWNGVRRVIEFPDIADPVELHDGILLVLDAPSVGNTNYTPGDYWTFPVRASGTPFDPALLPSKARPQGVHHHRVALAEINWNAELSVSAKDGEIDDCRHVFLPLTKQKGCCTYTVGDGVRSHGDFDSIEDALRQLPASGGEICLLPGLHQTNAVIQGKKNIRIHGCHANTKIVPRKEAPTAPLFHIVDSQAVVLERMDMVTLRGTAIVVEGSKEGAVSDIEIADNRILACQIAINVANGAGVAIHHNRIRMCDKRDSGVAIYLAADDSVIERNDIRLIPAPSMPPLNIPGEPTPIDPNDPCARLEVVHFNPLIFTRYVELVWLVPILYLPILVQPYQALGGIQLGGGSERVRVVENVIVGGAGNGITLGDGFEPPAPRTDLPQIRMPDNGMRLFGQVLGPDGKPVAGAQVTLTSAAGVSISATTDNGGMFVFTARSELTTYTVEATAPGLAIDKAELTQKFQIVITMKAAQTLPDASGFAFLYQIAIIGNDINAMGRSGVGVPGLRLPTNTGATLAASANALNLTATRLLLANPVIGLEIRGNRIVGCLRNPFDNALRAEAALRGLGGVSLGLCDDVAIAGNRIEANGTPANPTCGIFIYYGEGVDITANQILGNGPPPQTANTALVGGRRGGIVLNYVSSFNLLAGLAGDTTGARIKPRPAARVHENLVDQPVGQALYAVAYGPLSCTDNSFNSELSGLSAREREAGTVFIFNLGGTQKAPSAVQAKTGDATAPAANINRLQAGAVFTRNPAAVALLPSGVTLFNDNQSRTGAANTSAACQAIASMDDVSYQANQSESDGARQANLFSNVFVAGTTLRAVGSRFSEGTPTLLSLWTLTMQMNDTSLNQGDHCIIALNPDPAMLVQSGNLVSNPALCKRLSALAASLLFNLQG